MKKYRLHIASMAMAAAAVLSSCSDSYPGLEYPQTDNNGVSNNESYDFVPIMVFTNEQSLFSVSARGTRGTGPLDNSYEDDAYWKWKYRNADLYVYAFRAGAYAQGAPEGQGATADFTKSRWTSGDNVAGDCLLDGAGGHGIKMHFTADQPGYLEQPVGYENDIKGTEHDYMRYYSKADQEVPYNFFGYYVDIPYGSMPAARKENDRISYRFDIDGQQDVMCGYAPWFTTEEDIADMKSRLKDIPQDQIDKILNIGGFSSYAARRNVDPVIDLNHQLVRLNFKAFPGDKGADSLRIKKIYVTCPNTCDLVVASKDPAELGASWSGRADLYLKERLTEDDFNYIDEETGEKKEKNKDDVTVRELVPFRLSDVKNKNGMQMKYENWKALSNDEKTNGYYNVGGCLMVPVPPTDASYYEVTLVFDQPVIKGYDEKGDPIYGSVIGTEEDGTPIYGEAEVREVTAHYKVSLMNGKVFEKGKQYPVVIGVYGFQDIKLSANINHWIDSGDDVDVEEGADGGVGDMEGF